MEPGPILLSLRAELERLGYIVVPHGDHICVRLPLLASVTIYEREGHLRLEPQFGPFKRSTALTIGAVGIPTTIAAVIGIIGGGPATLVVAAGAAAYLVTDLYRLILTESCVGRLQAVWMGIKGVGEGRLGRPDPTRLLADQSIAQPVKHDAESPPVF
jgi:hypothetical protein